MKDTKTILLAFLSVGLVATWVYHLYDKTRYASIKSEDTGKQNTGTSASAPSSRYYSTLTTLDSEVDSARFSTEQLQNQLEDTLAVINRLRNELAEILVRKNFTQQDLAEARRKKIELELRIAELQNQSLSIEEEKKQIAASLNKTSVQVRNLEARTAPTPDRQPKAQPQSGPDQPVLFVASELRLLPVTVKNEKEQETNQAKNTNKLLVSFVLQNNNGAETDNAEVYVVVTQPDGQLLTGDAWESSQAMNTRTEGKKRYTRKVQFDYEKGETKRLNLSLSADDYQRGNYRLQVYHNGYMIGQTNKTLN